MEVPSTHVLTGPEPPIVLAHGQAALPSLPEVETRLPDVLVALPNGAQATLPGFVWPEQATTATHDPVPGPAPVQISRVKRREANRLLVGWGHELGKYRRPFAQQHFTLDVAGEPLAVASSGSIVSTTVEGHRRREVVELARLARDPDHRQVLRPLLRLWRLFLVDCWDYWPVEMAVAYALPGKSGDLYRFDGWTRVGRRRPSGGGGNWSSSAPKANTIADGVKTLWVFHYRDGWA